MLAYLTSPFQLLSLFIVYCCHEVLFQLIGMTLGQWTPTRFQKKNGAPLERLFGDNTSRTPLVCKL